MARAVSGRSFGRLQGGHGVATGSDLLASGDGRSSQARGIPVVVRHERQRRREPVQGPLIGGMTTGSDLPSSERSSGKMSTAVLSRHEQRRRCGPAEQKQQLRHLRTMEVQRGCAAAAGRSKDRWMSSGRGE